MKLWKVNDYEWWVGTDVESVKTACEALWGPAEEGYPYWDEYPMEWDTEPLKDYPSEDEDGTPHPIHTMWDEWQDVLTSGDTSARPFAETD